MQSSQKRPQSSSARDIRTKQRAFFELLDGLSGCHFAFNHLTNTRVVIKDRQGRFVWVSENVPSRHGLASPDGLFGLHDRDINPPSLAEFYWKDDCRVLQTGRPLLGKVQISFDELGMPDWFIVNKHPLRDRSGKVAGLIATIEPHPGLTRVPLLVGGLRKAAEYIQAHLDRPLLLHELACVAAMSARQLQRNFRSAIGLTPSEFIMRSRLAESCRRLRGTDIPIGTIALELGFCDQSAFTKAFRKHIGITPLEFRRARGTR